MKTAYDWFIIARDALDHSKKMALPEIKKVISRGEKIKVIPNDELKSLKQGIRQAKAWAMRARRVNPDSNEAEAAAEVKRLLEEYVYMLVEIPDEIAKLKKATSIYCLCRETHSSGLMVACDVSTAFNSLVIQFSPHKIFAISCSVLFFLSIDNPLLLT